jgi:hypothetical protein
MHPKSHQVSGLSQTFIGAKKQPLQKMYDLYINNLLVLDLLKAHLNYL